MPEMRKVPIFINGDQMKLVGWLVLTDTITDDEVVEASISWSMLVDNEGKTKLMDASLIPKLNVEK